MLAGKDHPETQQHRIEDTLTNVAVEDHERHMQPQSKPVNRNCIHIHKQAVYNC